MKAYPFNQSTIDLLNSSSFAIRFPPKITSILEKDGIPNVQDQDYKEDDQFFSQTYPVLIMSVL